MAEPAMHSQHRTLQQSVPRSNRLVASYTLKAVLVLLNCPKCEAVPFKYLGED